MSPSAVSRVDTLLANMTQRYHSDPVGNADLRPNTHVFNTVINCWSKSKDEDAASKAEEIFVAMETLHENGIPGLKPDVSHFQRVFRITWILISVISSNYVGNTGIHIYGSYRRVG